MQKVLQVTTCLQGSGRNSLGTPRACRTECSDRAVCFPVGTETYLVVEVVKQSEHAMLIIRIGLIDVLQQLDLIQTLVKIVLIVLQAQHILSDMSASEWMLVAMV